MDRIAASSRLTSASFTSATRSSSSTTFHAATTTDAFETRFGEKSRKGRKRSRLSSRLKSLGMTLAGFTAPVLLTACSGAQSQTAPVSPSSSVPQPAATSSPAPSSSSSPTVDPCDNTAELQQAARDAEPTFGDDQNDALQAIDAANEASALLEEQANCRSNQRTSP